MMSPPAPASALALFTPSSTVSTPLVMLQLRVGNRSELGLRQPSVVLPSHSNFQPSAFSGAVNVFSSELAGWAQTKAGLLKPAQSAKTTAQVNARAVKSVDF